MWNCVGFFWRYLLIREYNDFPCKLDSVMTRYKFFHKHYCSFLRKFHKDFWCCFEYGGVFDNEKSLRWINFLFYWIILGIIQLWNGDEYFRWHQVVKYYEPFKRVLQCSTPIDQEWEWGRKWSFLGTLRLGWAVFRF